MVRLLGPGDEGLLQRAALTHLGREWPADRCARALADPAFVAVAAEDGGEAPGFAYGYVLDRLHQTDLLLYSIDVLEARRREGIGRAMVERLKAVCAERGCGEMWVVTNASNRAAMRLYASAGGVREFDDVEMFVFPAPDEPRGGGS